MTYVDAILYYYYENGNSITTNAKYLASKDIYKVYDNRLEYFGNKGSAYAGFVNRTKKDYLDRIISRYKKSGSNELRSLYSEKYNAFKDNVSGVGYKIFKYSPALYFYLVKMKDKVS